METKKNIYTTPTFETITIDNEISLVLQSTPPDAPGEGIVMNNTDYFNNNPFHTENA